MSCFQCCCCLRQPNCAMRKHTVPLEARDCSFFLLVLFNRSNNNNVAHLTCCRAPEWMQILWWSSQSRPNRLLNDIFCVWDSNENMNQLLLLLLFADLINVHYNQYEERRATIDKCVTQQQAASSIEIVSSNNSNNSLGIGVFLTWEPWEQDQERTNWTANILTSTQKPLRN